MTDKPTYEELAQALEDYRYADAQLRKQLRKSEQQAADLAEACTYLTKAVEIYQRMASDDE